MTDIGQEIFSLLGKLVAAGGGGAVVAYKLDKQVKPLMAEIETLVQSKLFPEAQLFKMQE